MTGLILRCIGGFYTVRTDGGELLELRARGRFRLEGITPLPGDRAVLREGMIDELLPRKNRLTRPPVANIDRLCIVLSAHKPAPDLLLADKLLLGARMADIPVTIVINKTDAGRGREAALAAQYAGSGAECIMVSAKTGQGLGELADVLRGGLTALAGQSAVGKSSLINALCPQLGRETGGLAKKTDRGRHTTRVCELLELPGLGATVVDSPGFSMLAAGELEPESLASWYPDLMAAGKCRFDGCLHDREPDCAVKAALERGKISRERYERYIALLKELKERREKQYD